MLGRPLGLKGNPEKQAGNTDRRGLQRLRGDLVDGVGGGVTPAAANEPRRGIARSHRGVGHAGHREWEVIGVGAEVALHRDLVGHLLPESLEVRHKIRKAAEIEILVARCTLGARIDVEHEAATVEIGLHRVGVMPRADQTDLLSGEEDHPDRQGQQVSHRGQGPGGFEDNDGTGALPEVCAV